MDCVFYGLVFPSWCYNDKKTNQDALSHSRIRVQPDQRVRLLADLRDKLADGDDDEDEDVHGGRLDEHEEDAHVPPAVVGCGYVSGGGVDSVPD
ncbi:hypothetical protein JR316_0011180 [Psilocybe cubensis]|uniref:Uncharacterized protein n=1 Tax=Psilocybe cubensis TaxID=181762 RepID=A0ACB8GNL6_PSICU|nr:hypothetical protein JR316_0011180 [Psilocybe cubensis]KAH9477261.1 hypothetical protein JR316_0011180 [Psilocybe cubensis]